MTREEIRATVEGLERIAHGECHSYSYKEAGSRSETARDALTLIRELIGDAPIRVYHETIRQTQQVFAELGRE